MRFRFSSIVCIPSSLSVLAMTMVLLLATGCSAPQGAARFIEYKDAFETSRSASESLFILLEAAERNIVRAGSPATTGDFDPRRPYLYTDTAVTPLAREYRESFAAISRYNEVMVALITGEAATDVTDQLEELAVGISGLARVGFAGSKLNGADAMTSIGLTIVNETLVYRDRRVFAEELADSAEAVVALMVKMRDGSSTIYNNLSASAQSDGPQEDVARRRIVADWIVMMNLSIDALNLAVLSANSGHADVADLRALQQRLGELKAAAASLKNGLAALAN